MASTYPSTILHPAIENRRQRLLGARTWLLLNMRMSLDKEEFRCVFGP